MDLKLAIGRLGAEVFENSFAGIEPRVQFSIHLPLLPFEFEGERQDTEVVLEAIRLDVDDWRRAASQTFRFPTNPTPGYVDGSVYLDHVHNPVDVTRIRFGAYEDGCIPATLRLTIDFTYEGPDHLGVVEAEWEVELTIDEKGLDDVFREARERGIITGSEEA